MGKLLFAPLFVFLFLVTPLPALSESTPASNPGMSPQEAALVAAIDSAQKAIQRGQELLANQSTGLLRGVYVLRVLAMTGS
jgi:hypothetical protein